MMRKKGYSMHESILLEYPISEYEERINKLLSHMEQDGFTAIILTSKENTRYFCGLQSVSWKSKTAMPGVLIITSNGEIILVGSASAMGTMNATSCVENIYGFHLKKENGEPNSLPLLIKDILRQRKCDIGKIGMELGPACRMNMPVNDFIELVNLCSNATISDCSEIIFSLRMIKSENEKIFLRKSCEINYKSFEYAMNSISEGMTEYDLFRDTQREMLRLGADELFLFGVRAGKERYGQPNCVPSDRPIGRGEMILMDGGLIYKGFYSDIIRQAIIGKPNDFQKKYYDIAVMACEKAIEAVKPGNVIGEICENVNKYYSSLNLEEHFQKSCGHGIGLDIHERPKLNIDEKKRLEPGMAIAVEPSLYIPNIGMFGIEENLLVTESGYELLTKMTRELIVLE